MDYAILIARQRSGTGALGSVIDKHPNLKYLGEVFHPDNIGQDQNYFTYLRERVAQDVNCSLPDAQYGIFEDFLKTQAERHPNKTLVVDIKYRSLHHLNGGWLGLVERPTLLAKVISRKVPIVHLTRRNAVQSFVSGRLAEANKVWHATDAGRIEVRSTVVNVRQLSNYIVNTEREISLIEEWMRKYGHLTVFDYDEMFDAEGLVDVRIVDAIARTLDVPAFTDRAPTFIKQAPASVEDSIENFDLIKKALIGTDYAWMLK